MDKAIHFLNVLYFNKVFGIKIFHLTGYLCRKGRGIKTGNFSDTGFPVDKILPCSLNTHTNGCYKTQTCYDNSPAIHYTYDFFLLIYSMASLTVVIFSASSSGISIPNSSSNAITSSTVSNESAPRSLTKCEAGLISGSSTPNCSAMILRTRASTSM